MAFSGLITGTLGYGLKREFIGNSTMIRQVETFNYEISSVDFVALSANNIQNLIKSQFANVYSGDIHVKVFDVSNSFQYPNDSIRASRYNVTVEIKDSIPNINTQQPELTAAYYSGLDGGFWGTYGQYLLDFKEDFNFSTNDNGNRTFAHHLSFGLQTGWLGSNTQTGRKSYAQIIASGIFAQDQNTTFGLTTMLGQVSGVANTGIFRNYYDESYDLFRNVYSFSRHREELPFDEFNGSIQNLNYNIVMAEDGTIDVTEKATTQGYISFLTAQNNLTNYLTGAFTRCSGKYNQFYNSSIILQDPEYGSFTSLLPLINTPVKTLKTFDAPALVANYEVTFTNNPTFSGDNTITSQTLEFNIGEYDQVEATHIFDYTVNRIVQNSGYLVTGLMANTTGSSPGTMKGYYTTNFPVISGVYPQLNLIKSVLTTPNIKTKGSAKFMYSNNPTYFVTINGVIFSVLDYTVEVINPPDIINEYKIVNPPGNSSILSYEYQTERGQVNVRMKAIIGKNSNQFYPDGIGSFANLDNIGKPLIYFLQPLYMLGGQVLLQQFNYPIEGLNWYLNESKYSLDSDSNLIVDFNYIYTLKKRNYPDNP